MNIDSISRKVVSVALYLENISPNSISEIWIDENVVKQLKLDLPTPNTIDQFITETDNEIRELKDINRRRYLKEILVSLQFQIVNNATSLSDFYRNSYGFDIPRVTHEELNTLENKIKEIESEISANRFDVFRSIEIPPGDVLAKFLDYLEKTKKNVPPFLTEVAESEFQYELVKNKPWTAFNTHYAPYKSKLTINESIPITQHDLHHLSQHEAWGGHHSELSLKDRLLVNEGRGEHGMVIVYSPQVFISEGIAEAMFDILGFKDAISVQELLIWHYNRLLFALNNYFAFSYFEDKKSIVEIEKELENFDIGRIGRMAVLNFATDSIYGRYSAVYYSARDFILDVYNKTKQKEAFIKYIFTEPCTPALLTSLFPPA